MLPHLAKLSDWRFIYSTLAVKSTGKSYYINIGKLCTTFLLQETTSFFSQIFWQAWTGDNTCHLAHDVVVAREPPVLLVVALLAAVVPAAVLAAGGALGRVSGHGTGSRLRRGMGGKENIMSQPI